MEEIKREIEALINVYTERVKMEKDEKMLGYYIGCLTSYEVCLSMLKPKDYHIILVD